jgi:hypothetical protein
MATGALTNLSIAVESSYGAAVTAPSYSRILYRQGGPEVSRDSLDDDSLRSDRQRQGVRPGAFKTTCPISTWHRFGANDKLLEAAFGGTWTEGGVLKGGITRRSHLMEQHFADTDVASDKPYHFAHGYEVGGFSLKLAANQMVSLDFTGMFRNLEPAAAAISSSTYDNFSTNEAYTSFENGFLISEGGAPIAIVTSLSLDFDNGLEPLYVVGSNYTLLPDIKRFIGKGQLEVWFKAGAGALIDKFIAGTPSSLGFTLIDPDGNTEAWSLPNLTYTGGNAGVKGDGSIPVPLPFEISYDAVAASAAVITATEYVAPGP